MLKFSGKWQIPLPSSKFRGLRKTVGPNNYRTGQHQLSVNSLQNLKCHGKRQWSVIVNWRH